MQVPRVVAKRVPYSYTVRTPRTVVLRVPLDACGNPLPAVAPVSMPAAPAAPTLPSASTFSAETARPATMAAPTLQPPTPAPAAGTSAADARGPMKTYSDRPADAAPAAAEGWGASTRDHVDPRAGSETAASGAGDAYRAERPASDATPLRPIEAMPEPAVEQPQPSAADALQPTVAPPGPAVYPPQPAGSTRNLPTAETSAPNGRRGASGAHAT
jgi:hypothetical protein